MQMWPGHAMEHEFDMEGASRMANMLHAAHVPLAMSLCRMDYSNLKMQASFPNHMYSPSAFEGILELRKEKSRDAARSRRGKENYEFYELAKLLPLPSAITSQLDKASIIRLTISYLKLRDFSSHGDPPWIGEGSNTNGTNKGGSVQRRNSVVLAQDIFETHQGTHILQSLDGFAFALSNDGRFLYISETVSIYLGLSQVEMAGSSIFEYIHANDHKELAEQLGLNSPKGSYFHAATASATSSDDESSNTGMSHPQPTTNIGGSSSSQSDRVSIMSPNPSRGYDRCFCIRMKSTLTKRGVHFKSSGYRVVQIVAHLRPQISYPANSRKQLPPLLGLVGMAIALPPPTITELIIDNDMFVTRLSPQLKVTYCEPRISDLMDISAEDLLNKSLYDHCHAEDLQKLHRAHKDLLGKGQVLTDYYRLMNRHGGYIWLQTCATIICNAKNAEEQNIIAINYVLSGVEYAGCIMNLDQYRAVNKQDPEPIAYLPNISEKESPVRVQSSSTRPLLLERGALSETTSLPNGSDTKSAEDSLRSPPLTQIMESPQPVSKQDSRSRQSLHVEISENHEDEQVDGTEKADSKLLKKKTEKPRKRKRTQQQENGADIKHSKHSEIPGAEKAPNIMIDGGEASSFSGALKKPSEEQRHRRTSGFVSSVSPFVGLKQASESSRVSSTPEDLSMMRLPMNSPVISEKSHHKQDNMAARQLSSSNHSEQWAELSADQATGSGYRDESYMPVGDKQQASTVLDLEQAMNKHLPAPAPEQLDPDDSSLRGNYSSQLALSKHKTIQWSGSGSYGFGQHQGSADLTTASLLRSLYPNRESVIRTNVHGVRSSAAQYYTDIQNALLTPPSGGGGASGCSNDLYRDSFAASLLGHTKAASNGYNLMNGYSAVAPGLGVNMTDSYGMTPPSSASPHEGHASQFISDHLHGSTHGSGFDQGYCGLPIRPHAYSFTGAQFGGYDHASAGAMSGYQGYYASSAYGCMTGAAGTSAAMAAAQYRDAMKNVNGW